MSTDDTPTTVEAHVHRHEIFDESAEIRSVHWAVFSCECGDQVKSRVPKELREALEELGRGKKVSEL